MLGSPGQVNPPCPAPDTEIDWCRLQHPLDEVDVLAGTPFAVYGRVFEADITDRSDGVDEDPALVAEAGFGPAGSDPDGHADWRWTGGGPTPDWDAATAGEPGNDEYVATFPAPAAGDHDFAFRFSRDGGLSWRYCDRAAGMGMDGSEDGYLPQNAGHLATIPSPCDPSPCEVAPPADCDEDGVTVITWGAPGACTVDGIEARCDYPFSTQSCAAGGGTCEAGACVGMARAPEAGEVLFTEIMYDTEGDLLENNAEWIELHNVAGEPLSLAGCSLTDTSTTPTPIEALVLPTGGYAVFARSADPALNGGIDVAGTLAFGLNNPGDDLALTCAAGRIDAVAYDDGGDFPDARRFSISLDPDAFDADANDLGAN